MNRSDAEVLDALLKTTLQAMKERVPDWYGRALKALADVSESEILSGMAARSYQDELAEAIVSVPALPGTH